MTLARKLELVCGVIIGILEVILIVLGLKEAIEVSTYLNKLSELFLDVIVAILLYLFPCIMVLLGSYFHATKRQSKGMGFLVIGCSVILCVFLISLYALAVKGYHSLTVKLSLALPVMAIITMLVSFVVEWQNRKTRLSL